MRDLRPLRLALVLLLLAACPGSYDKPRDGAGVDGVEDLSVIFDDTGAGQDSAWPDVGMPDLAPDTAYSPGPFGCHTDNDCFGTSCCATPWGVRLCAASCEW